MGTVGYMSPEQASGEEADHRADIFSFGAILYEMFTGQRAFQGKTAVEVLNAILKEEPAGLAESAEAGRHFALGPERVLHRCLAKKPEERFQSASDLAFAIESLAQDSRLDVASGSNLSAIATRSTRREGPGILSGRRTAAISDSLPTVNSRRSRQPADLRRPYAMRRNGTLPLPGTARMTFFSARTSMESIAFPLREVNRRG